MSPILDGSFTNTLFVKFKITNFFNLHKDSANSVYTIIVKDKYAPTLAHQANRPADYS